METSSEELSGRRNEKNVPANDAPQRIIFPASPVPEDHCLINVNAEYVTAKIADFLHTVSFCPVLTFHQAHAEHRMAADAAGSWSIKAGVSQLSIPTKASLLLAPGHSPLDRPQHHRFAQAGAAQRFSADSLADARLATYETWIGSQYS